MEKIKTPEELISRWEDAKARKSEAEKEIKACQQALLEVDCPIGKPIVGSLGIIRMERRNYEYDRKSLETILPAGVIEHMITVNKTKLKNWVEEEGKNIPNIDEKIKDCQVETEEPTMYYILKKIKG